MTSVILTIDGVALPVEPSKCTFSLKDISTSDSGRTEDTEMQKKRIGQTWTINLEWSGLTNTQARDIARMFNPVYLEVEYFDYMVGDAVTDTFYKGDSDAPLYNATLGIWTSLSFNLIQRKGKVFNTTSNTWDDIEEENNG